MDPSVLLLALASFVGGLLVTSRVASWITLLVQLVGKAGAGGRVVRSGLAMAPLLLHSGPWALAIAVAAIYYAATSPRHEYLWAVAGGLLLAAAMLIWAVLLRLWRQRRPKLKPEPLTPERLLAKRRRFFWLNSLVFALLMPVLPIYLSPGMSRSESQLLALFMGLGGFGIGWLWSWFMWQWYGEVLKANEKARLRREQANGV